MKASNITIRPNVFIREDTDLCLDSRFISQVRGRGALLKLLQKIRPGARIEDGFIAGFCQRQMAELASEVPCSDCGGYPEGPVVKNGKESIEFRCPRSTCTQELFVGRLVMLPVDLVKRAVRQEHRTLPEIVSDALTVSEQGCSLPSSGVGEVHPFPIRLTPTQNLLLSDQEIGDALRVWVGEDE
jgi:hypothetical protein